MGTTYIRNISLILKSYKYNFSIGLIAVPLNSMLSVNGNCSYNPSDHQNYIYPNRICKIDHENSIIKVEKRYCDWTIRSVVNIANYLNK